MNITRARTDVQIFTDDKESMRDHAGIMQYKRDTLEDKSISLDTALVMENRIKQLAMASAQQKIELAKTFAKSTTEKIKESKDFTIDFSETKWISIQNEKMFEKIGSLEGFKKAVQQRVEDAESLLNNSKIFSHDEKQKIADFLLSPKAEKLFFSDQLTSIGRLFTAADMIRLRENEFVKDLPKQEQIIGIELIRSLSKGHGFERNQ